MTEMNQKVYEFDAASIFFPVRNPRSDLDIWSESFLTCIIEGYSDMTVFP